MGLELGNWGWVRGPKHWDGLSKMDVIKRESGFQQKADATRKGHAVRIAGSGSPGSKGGSTRDLGSKTRRKWGSRS